MNTVFVVGFEWDDTYSILGIYGSKTRAVIAIDNHLQGVADTPPFEGELQVLDVSHEETAVVPRWRVQWEDMHFVIEEHPVEG